MEGMTLKITLDSKKSTVAANSKTQVEQIELMPVVIENASTPRLGNETETQLILKKVGATEKIIKPKFSTTRTQKRQRKFHKISAFSALKIISRISHES